MSRTLSLVEDWARELIALHEAYDRAPSLLALRELEVGVLEAQARFKEIAVEELLVTHIKMDGLAASTHQLLSHEQHAQVLQFAQRLVRLRVRDRHQKPNTPTALDLCEARWVLQEYLISIPEPKVTSIL